MNAEDSFAPLIHRMLRAVVLIGFAMLIIHLKRTGELALFVTPRIEQAVKLSALGLLAAGAYQAYSFFRMWPNRSRHLIDDNCACEHDHGEHHHHIHSHDHAHHHDHDHDHTSTPVRSVLLYGLFLLLLAVGFFMPHKPLDSDLNGKLGTTVHSHVKGE
ncbi:DUF1980 domain-containing protein [Paenibacillus sp. PR3]|uniref:DUF1980 domain-containing protein n=1 Tax=Paenibacillus terricola TaxID=2763503 RepID=A0ABR8MYT0_9BACL|nr:DUF1980 domain-containing protein [Paenibacillus terricola]MBD3920196.1 DUF1980 domain-containing protein [Paenibacillus terricola]